jgi:hypothetical protein
MVALAAIHGVGQWRMRLNEDLASPKETQGPRLTYEAQ